MLYTTREILLEEENLKEGERELEKFYLRKRICESRPGLEVQGCISCSATFDSPPNDSEWMSIARKAENRETQAASKSPEPAGRTCAVWTYQYIVIMKIHYMSLPKKDQELGICQLLVSSTEATFVAFVGLIKYA